MVFFGVLHQPPYKLMQTTKRSETWRVNSLKFSFTKLRDFQVPTTWNDIMLMSLLCFSQSVYKTCHRQPKALTFFRLIFYYMYKFQKMQTSVGPNRILYISFESFWWELSKNVIFIEFESWSRHLCQAIPWPLITYGHVTWLWLQISKIFIY